MLGTESRNHLLLLGLQKVLALKALKLLFIPWDLRERQESLIQASVAVAGLGAGSGWSGRMVWPQEVILETVIRELLNLFFSLDTRFYLLLRG